MMMMMVMMMMTIMMFQWRVSRKTAHTI